MKKDTKPQNERLTMKLIEKENKKKIEWKMNKHERKKNERKKNERKFLNEKCEHGTLQQRGKKSKLKKKKKKERK